MVKLARYKIITKKWGNHFDEDPDIPMQKIHELTLYSDTRNVRYVIGFGLIDPEFLEKPKDTIKIVSYNVTSGPFTLTCDHQRIDNLLSYEKGEPCLLINYILDLYDPEDDYPIPIKCTYKIKIKLNEIKDKINRPLYDGTKKTLYEALIEQLPQKDRSKEE